MTIKPPRGIAPGGPQVQGQPWETVDKSQSVDRWDSVEENAGTVSIETGEVTSSFPDGPGPWRQT